MAGRIAKTLSFLTPKRRWLQFSLGTMLLAVTLLCVWLADYVSPVRKLERQLNDPDVAERVIAAQRLGYMGPVARSATKSLLRAMEHRNADLRRKAVWALSRITRNPDLLLPFLSDGENDVKVAAAEGILWADGEPTRVFSALMASGCLEGGAARMAMNLAPDKSAAVLPLLLDALGSDSELLIKQADYCLAFLSVPTPTVTPILIDRLGHVRPQVRKVAAEQLLYLASTDHAAVPALMAALHDPDLAVAAAVAAALGTVDPHNKDYLRVFKKALRSGDARLVANVARYLYQLGPAAAEAADDLVAGLCDPRVCNEPYYGYIIIWAPALKRLGAPAIYPVERTLRHALASQIRLQAFSKARRDELKMIGDAAMRVTWWALSHLQAEPNGSFRRHLARTFSDRLRQALVRTLESVLDELATLTMPATRQETVFCLAYISPPARSLPTLIAALDDCTDHAPFRQSAINVLGRIGKDAAPAAGRLIDFLDTDDEYLRRSVFKTLSKIGVSDEFTREKLRHFLTNGDLVDRFEAARALAACGEPSHEVVPKLMAVALDPYFNGSQGTYPAMLDSIASIGPAAIPELQEALKDQNPKVRRAAAAAVGKIGPAASTTVPRLIEMLDDARCWDAAAEALGGISTDGHRVTPKLIEILVMLRMPANSDANADDPDEDDFYDWDGSQYVPILKALRGIGSDAREALPEVLRLTSSSNPKVSHAAIMALVTIDPANRALMARLRGLWAEWERTSSAFNDIPLFRDDDYRLPREGLAQLADAVWRLGHRADELIPDLRRMVAAPLLDDDVRCYAAYALASFSEESEVAIKCLENLTHHNMRGPAKELLDRIHGEDTSAWSFGPFIPF